VTVPAKDRRHYGGDYHARSKALRAAAYADPSARCWRCGLTMAEFVASFPRRRSEWHADHVVPGDRLSPLRPAHASCNTSEGARNSHGTGMNPSRRWY